MQGRADAYWKGWLVAPVTLIVAKDARRKVGGKKRDLQCLLAQKSEVKVSPAVFSGSLDEMHS